MVDTDAAKMQSYVGRLRLRLVVIALLSMMIIVSATGYGLYRIYVRHILSQAEEDAVQISEALLIDLRELLFATGVEGPPELSLADEGLYLGKNGGRNRVACAAAP